MSRNVLIHQDGAVKRNIRNELTTSAQLEAVNAEIENLTVENLEVTGGGISGDLVLTDVELPVGGQTDALEVADTSTLGMYRGKVVPDWAYPMLREQGMDRSINFDGQILSAGTGTWTSLGEGMEPGELFFWDRTGATEVFVASQSADDTELGSGCRWMLVEYINLAGAWERTAFAMDGLTPVSIGFVQVVTRMIGVQFGGAERAATNTGRIYCGSGVFTAGKPVDIWHVMEADTSLSHCALYCVPADRCAVYTETMISTDSTSRTSDFQIRLRSVSAGGITVPGTISAIGWSLHVIGNLRWEQRGQRCIREGSIISLEVRSDQAIDCHAQIGMNLVNIIDYPNVV